MDTLTLVNPSSEPWEDTYNSKVYRVEPYDELPGIPKDIVKLWLGNHDELNPEKMKQDIERVLLRRGGRDNAPKVIIKEMMDDAELQSFQAKRKEFFKPKERAPEAKMEMANARKFSETMKATLKGKK
jgi:hypothetical protein